MRRVAFFLAVALATPVVALDLTTIPLQAVETYGGFDFPVSFAFAPDGRVFVTEKAGAVRVIANGTASTWANVPVADEGEQGLLGLALHPDFAANGWVYVYHADPANGTNRVARLTDAGGAGSGLVAIVPGIPNAVIHNGGVLTFGLDGTLFVSTGDATDEPAAQDPARLNGKVLRVNGDGSLPGDNPFPSSPVYSYGHRNVFGLAVDPNTGDLWETENGPSQDDEVNRIIPGGNYGWPNVTGGAGRPEFVDPAFVFPGPLPALTQATFFQGALFFGGWNSGSVYRAILTPDRRAIALLETVHTFAGRGVTDVESGPDGRLYVSAVSRGGAGGAIFAFDSLPPIGGTRGDHIVAYAVVAAVVAGLVLVYAWKRRQMRPRERS